MVRKGDCSVPRSGVSVTWSGWSLGSISSMLHIRLMNGQKLLSLVVRTNNVTVYSLISLWVFHLGNESRNSAISYRGKRSSENGIRPLHLTVFYMERRKRVYSGCFLIIDRVDSMNSRLIQSNWVWLCAFCYVTSKWNNRMKTDHDDNITLSTGFILISSFQESYDTLW